MAKAAAPRSQANGPQPLGWGTHLTTVLLGTWLMIGLFVDGWAHNNIPTLETFFTPWHALFYSGFAVTAAFLVWTVARHVRPHGGLLTPAGRAAIPAGYGWGVIGVIIFGIGGVGDMIWHIIFGIEKDFAALLSPTHTLIFLGGILIMTTPLRATWDMQETAPRFRQFFPTLLSATMATAFIAFMFMYLYAPAHGYAEVHMHNWYKEFLGATREMQEMGDILGIANFLVTNLVYLAVPLLMLSRWRLPFGAITFFFAVLGTLMEALRAFHSIEMLVGIVVLGLLGDLLVRLLKVAPGQVMRLRIFAMAFPVLIWGVYFLALAAMGQLGWPPEIFGGVIAWTSISGLGLSLLLAPRAKSLA